MSPIMAETLNPPRTQAAAIAAGYARLVRRRLLIVAALVVLVLAAFTLDLATGPSGLTVMEALRGILDPGTLSRPAAIIMWEVRLPMALMALLIGAALALAGAEMQTILANPLADPFTLGVSSAASLGAALAIVLGFGLPGVPQSWVLAANAFVFAFGSVLLIQTVGRLRGAGADTLILFGIALVFSFNGLVALIQFMASQDALQQLVFWGMGSLARANWTTLGVLAAVVAAVTPFCLADAWKLTALRLGEERARSFGIHVPRLRFMALFRVSLLAATSVAFAGTIGFVGLVGPHIARLLIGEDHRFFLPVSALTGALVMSLASTASKLIVPGALIPIGIVTTFVGLPVFLSLILRRRHAP